MDENRYDIQNLPISNKTYEGLTSENINYIGVVGRMLLVQDKLSVKTIEDLQQVISDQNYEILSRLTAIEKRLDAFDTYSSLKETVMRHGFTAIVTIIVTTALVFLMHSFIVN
jgi:hypothetical protein